MLRNNTILITGGGSGIGEALALQLAPENKVIICGRNLEKLKKVSACHTNISHEKLDVADPRSIQFLFDTLRQQGIRVDVLINNAGMAERWDITGQYFSPVEIFQSLSTNLAGPVAMVQQFIAQADCAADNLIVNNTSEIAIMPVPLLPLYSASKAGLSVFTRALRLQLKHTNFRVVELMPPGVNTDMPRQLNNTGKLMDTQVFVRRAISSIRQGKNIYAPGRNVPLLKLFRSLFPRAGIKLIDKMSRKQLA